MIAPVRFVAAFAVRVPAYLFGAVYLAALSVCVGFAVCADAIEGK